MDTPAGEVEPVHDRRRSASLMETQHGQLCMLPPTLPPPNPHVGSSCIVQIIHPHPFSLCRPEEYCPPHILPHTHTQPPTFGSTSCILNTPTLLPCHSRQTRRRLHLRSSATSRSTRSSSTPLLPWYHSSRPPHPPHQVCVWITPARLLWLHCSIPPCHVCYGMHSFSPQGRAHIQQ